MLDWTTALILAGVATLEGLRRTPRASLVLTRLGLDDWRVRQMPSGSEWPRLVSWGAPFALHVVVRRTEHFQSPPGLKKRWRHLMRWLSLIRVLATFELLFLVLGVPAAVGRWGASGLIAAMLVVLWAVAVLTAYSAAALRSAGLPRRDTWRAVRPLLSPFATPRAPEIVIEAALAGVPQLAAVRLLMSPSAFARWIRPRAYDSVQDGCGDSELHAVLAPEQCRSLIEEAPGPHPFCPRCGTTYRTAVPVCADCGTVVTTVPRDLPHLGIAAARASVGPKQGPPR